MVNKEFSPETRILEAAKIVFHRKGFDGARMQEIASLAGINKALLHYYFRSKENLFDAVFRDAFENLFRKIFSTLNSDSPMEDKLRYVFNDYISFLQQNSFIPWFILNSIHHDPGKLAELLSGTGFSPQMIFDGMKRSVSEENLDVRDPRQLVINVIALSVFPIVAKPMLKIILGLSEEEFDGFIEFRKKELPEFVMNAIRKR